MKKSIICLLSGVFVFLISSSFILKYSTGLAEFTNSPGEPTCTQCHIGTTNAANGLSITSLPTFNNNEYIPGLTYTINIIVGAVSFSNFGFDCEILNSTNQNIGIMQNAAAGVQFMTGFGGKKNATHIAPKFGNETATFTFEWVAPANGISKIYAAGLCADLSGNPLGDVTVTNSLTLNPANVNYSHENNSKGTLNFSVYPNPASEVINVNYASKVNGIISVDLYGINGKLICNLISTESFAGESNLKTRVPQNVTSGFYFIRLNLNGKKIGQRLLNINKEN
jgi:hypothetical protein